MRAVRAFGGYDVTFPRGQGRKTAELGVTRARHRRVDDEAALEHGVLHFDACADGVAAPRPTALLRALEVRISADSKTGEEQRLRKVDETLIVDFKFLLLFYGFCSWLRKATFEVPPSRTLGQKSPVLESAARDAHLEMRI